MKARIAILTMLLLLIVGTAFAEDDTGTYTILDYAVTVKPDSTGNAQISYYQKWEVTGGHIPWITIGTPNEHFTPGDCGKNATKIESHNESGWSGVKLELDRDYQAGESFEVSCSIQQGHLYSVHGKDADQQYTITFTPGWYPNAETNHLTITMESPVDLSKVTTDPPASSSSGRTVSWTFDNLGKDEKSTVSITFGKADLPEAIPESNLEKGPSAKTIVLIVIIVIVVIIVLVALSDGGSYGGGGGIFYGSSGGGGRGSGGGGGFGGASVSCACVNCACACACAGGGGAGCSRKERHSCPHCRDEDKEGTSHEDV